MLVFALVAVVVLTGIPVVLGMPAADCADCGLGMLVASSCVAGVLTALAGAALALLALQLRTRAAVPAVRLATSGLYRPPRPA